MEKNFEFQLEVPGAADKKEKFEVFAFNQQGRLIASHVATGEKVSLKLSSQDSQTARIFILPQNKMYTVRNLNDAIRLKAYEPFIHPAQRLSGKIDKITISEEVYKFWLWCFCTIQGKVVNDACNHSPVYHAKVHICSVESLWDWIEDLIEDDIIRLRNHILWNLTEQVPNFPPQPDPGPEFNKYYHLAERKIAAPDRGLSEKLNIIQNFAETLPQEHLALFYSSSAVNVRTYLKKHANLLYPHFCGFDLFVIGFEELAVAETDANGRFSAEVIYACEDDGLDVYCWVEYLIGGVWTTIYKPFWKGCHTIWDYQCGTDITIHVNNAHIPCQTNTHLQGRVVCIKTIGNNESVTDIDQTTGLTWYGSPFAGSLQPQVLFGDGLHNSGGGEHDISHYRWSYKLASAPDTDWQILDDTVVRHYWNAVYVGTTLVSLSFPAYVLGADGNNLFKVPPVNTPNGQPWATVDAVADNASAYFNTLSRLAATASGLYELKLEFFDAAGNRFNLTDQNVQLAIPAIGQHAPFGNATMNTLILDPAVDFDNQYLLMEAGKVVGYKMNLFVDNNNVSAWINSVASDGPNDACGFKVYNSSASVVTTNMHASQPNGFGICSMGISGGQGASIYSGPISGAPSDVNVNTAISSLLNPGCNRGAFSANVSARATAVNGWSYQFDWISPSEPFALISAAENDCN